MPLIMTNQDQDGDSAAQSVSDSAIFIGGTLGTATVSLLAKGPEASVYSLVKSTNKTEAFEIHLPAGCTWIARLAGADDQTSVTVEAVSL